MLRKVLISIGALVFIALAGILGSSILALDWDYQHTSRAAGLPLVGDVSDGLVRIPAGGFEFRARVAGLGSDGAGVILLHGLGSREWPASPRKTPSA